jgi:N-acetylglucosamine kinase-like BadF-type ATPase
MGDEGSGYDIARRALSAATRGADGRGPETALSRTIPRFLGYPDLRALHGGIYSFAVTRDQLASLATPVGRAARQGDAVAQGILADAAAHLAEAAAVVAQRLALRRPRASIVGGVAQCGRWLWEPFAASLRAKVPDAHVLRPRFQPAVGAVLAAYRSLGGPFDPSTLARLRASQRLLHGVKYG